MIPYSVEDIENEVYNKKSLIIFTERTHGKLDAVPLASEPQASRPVVLACGPLAYWPTGLQRLQPVPGDAPFWCCFEFRKAKFASKRHERLVRINVSAIIEGLYLISANAHFDCAICEVVISSIHASTIRTSLGDLGCV